MRGLKEDMTREEIKSFIEAMSEQELEQYIERIKNASTEELEKLASNIFKKITSSEHYRNNYKTWNKIERAFLYNYNISEKLFNVICISCLLNNIINDEWMQNLKNTFRNIWKNRNNYKLIKDKLFFLLFRQRDIREVPEDVIIDNFSTSGNYGEVLHIAGISNLMYSDEGKKIVEILWEKRKLFEGERLRTLVSTLIDKKNYDVDFINQVAQTSNNYDEISVIVDKIDIFSEDIIRTLWNKRNLFREKEDFKSFIINLIKQYNIPKDILIEAFNEFKNDVDISMHILVSGIEYEEVYSLVLENSKKDEILVKLKDKLYKEKSIRINPDYRPNKLREILTLSRIVEEDILEQILRMYSRDDWDRELSPAAILVPGKEESFKLNEFSSTKHPVVDKIYLNIAKNSNATISILKYIVKSTTNEEIINHCIENSGNSPEITKEVGFLEEFLYQNQLKNLTAGANVGRLICSNGVEKCYEYILSVINIVHMEGRLNQFKEYEDLKYLFLGSIWTIINKYPELIKIIQEKIQYIDYEKMSSGEYKPNDFQTPIEKEKAYIDCILNYGLLNEEDVKEFVTFCLGKDYYERYERDTRAFNELGYKFGSENKKE